MTFFGNKRSGRHLLRNIGRKHKGKAGAGTEELADASSPGRPVKEKKPKWSLKKKLLVIPGIVVGALAVLTLAAFAYLKWAVSRDPVVNQHPAYVAATYTPYDPDNPQPSGKPPSSDSSYEAAANEQPVRTPNKYTFLVLATDDGSNTDTIMVATFDKADMTFNVVNIPRDTMVNVSWSLKKANSILSNMRYRHRGESDELQKAMDDTAAEFARILGFHVDYWALVNLRAFVTLIDTVGGVDFYVPVYMNYDDPFQNLHIHYNKGMQYLRGQQALEVVRFRDTYASGDIGRIGVQQNFLTAAVQQILEKRNTVSVVDFVTDLATVFIRDVKTNIPFDDLVWFGNLFMNMDADAITFETAPGNYGDFIGPESYVTLYVDEWLDLVNRKLSPLDTDITDTGVSILTRGADRRLYVTDGIRVGEPSWGANSRGPSPEGTSGSSGSSGSSGGAPSVPAENPAVSPDGDPDGFEDGLDDSGDDPSEYDPDAEDTESSIGEQDEYDPEEPDDQSEPAPSGEDVYEHPEHRSDIPTEVIEPLDEDPYERNEDE